MVTGTGGVDHWLAVGVGMEPTRMLLANLLGCDCHVFVGSRYYRDAGN
jgi:hypothetical protein